VTAAGANVIINSMDRPRLRSRDASAIRRDADANEAARREVLRGDAQRSLGENIERAAALIKAAFEIRDAFSEQRT
jgi:hypothetical protein